MNEKLIPNDPAKHFGFPQCATCLLSPCRQLRAGLVNPGSFVFVSRNYYGFSDCPFAAQSPHIIAEFLLSLDFYTLNDIYNTICYDLTENERFTYNQDFFLNSWEDADGRIAYILHLLEQQVIVAIGLPFGFEQDPKIRKWFYAFKGQVRLPGEIRKAAQDDASPAATDAMAEEKKEEISISNPRWEHKDEEMKKNSPDKARLGDAIILKADVSGIAEGGDVSFSVYDANLSPQKIYATVKGKNKSGTATAEWVVKDPRQKDEDREVQFKFEASAKGKVSQMKEISLKNGIFVIQLMIDPDTKESQDDTFTLFSTDSAKSYSQTLTVKDDKVSYNDYLDLEFTGMDKDLSYSLEVNPGKEGEVYYLFENKSYGELNG